MASSAFNHIEVGLAVAVQPNTSADLRVLHHPSGFQPQMSRVILHETLHLWQYLSSGYLAGLVEEDWERLKTFERTGTPAQLGPRALAFRQRSDLLPFTAKDLQEGLARFWDVHIIGPPLLIELELADPNRSMSNDFVRQYMEAKQAGLITHPVTGGYSSLSYEMAMVAAAGNYGKPYLWLRQQTGDLMANVLFPLCGHFAFQTPDPLRAFNMLVRYGSHEFPKLDPGRKIHEWWRERYFVIGRLAVQAVRQFWKQDDLEHIGTAVTEGGLTDHPVWQPLFEVRRVAGVGFKSVPLFDRPQDFDPSKLDTAHGQLNLDYAMGCPGDPDYRGMLIRYLAPSTVRFPDDTAWNLGSLAAIDARNDQLMNLHNALANESRKLRYRWDCFVRAKVGY